MPRKIAESLNLFRSSLKDIRNALETKLPSGGVRENIKLSEVAGKIREIEVKKTGNLTVNLKYVIAYSTGIRTWYNVTIRITGNLDLTINLGNFDQGSTISYQNTFSDIPVGQVNILVYFYPTSGSSNPGYLWGSNPRTVEILQNQTVKWEYVKNDPPVTEGPWYEGMENLTPSEESLVMDVPEKELLNEDL